MDINTKSELLEAIRRERTALQETVNRLQAEQLRQPALEDGWSVQDALAHIVSWEQLMLKWVRQLLHGETPDRPAPGEDAADWDIDRLNQELLDANRQQSLEQVLADFARSYEEVLGQVEHLSEDELFRPDYFPWRNDDPLWHMVAANTCWHYPEHREAIARAWPAA